MAKSRFNQLIEELVEEVEGFENERPSLRALNMRQDKVYAVFRAFDKVIEAEKDRTNYCDHCEKCHDPSELDEKGRCSEVRRIAAIPYYEHRGWGW